ncbi:29655_t:CDS:1, partial [Racocetra persica]
LTDVQEEQFRLFFLDRDNVAMSSYNLDKKTELLVLYLQEQKSDLWEKFNETYPDGMKRTSFMDRLATSTNLRYCKDLGRLCIICNDYRYETFENLTNIINTTFMNNNELK